MTQPKVTIYQLRLALADVTPPVWRLIEVPADFSLDWLHDVIQWAMGWEHEQSYRFYGGEFAYVESPQVHHQELGKEVDATHHTLQKVFGNRSRYLRYVYDMGDHWWHHVWLEDTFPAAMEVKYPRLVGGERACPPEDFGGVADYTDFLHGALPDDDPRAGQFAEFDPEAFDSSPRPFPNARTYVEGQEEREATRPVAFQPRGAETLGELHDRAAELLDEAERIDDTFRADLRRALEDVTLAEDALPPKTADTLQRARDEGIGIADFLLDCVRNYKSLTASYSTAPFHAAHLLSFWHLDEGIAVFEQVLRDVDDDAEGMVETMVRALIWSGRQGIEVLLDALDELSEEKRRIAVNRLCREGLRDDRLLEQLREFLHTAGPHDANVPYLLAQYGDERAIDLLHDALDAEIAFLTEQTDADDEERAKRTDYALFLTEMLADAGETLDDNQWRALEELEDFYWPSPAYKKRLRRR